MTNADKILIFNDRQGTIVLWKGAYTVVLKTVNYSSDKQTQLILSLGDIQWSAIDKCAAVFIQAGYERIELPHAQLMQWLHTELVDYLARQSDIK